MDAFRAARDAADEAAAREAREAEFREMVLAAIAVPSPDEPAADSSAPPAEADSTQAMGADGGPDNDATREAKERDFLAMFAEAIQVPSPGTTQHGAEPTLATEVMSAAESKEAEIYNERMAAAAREATERIDVEEFAEMLAAAIHVPSEPE